VTARRRLAPLEMSVPASDGLILKGTLTYPETPAGTEFPLAVLAHQYPATRDSFAPLVHELLGMGIATLAFDLRGHGASLATPRGQLVIDTPVGFDLAAFGTAFVSSASKVGFSRIPDDVVRVASWGVAQNFVDGSRVGLVGGSIGGSGVVLAAPLVPGLRAVLTFGAAGALAIGDDAPARCRAAVESITAATLLTSAQDDPFDGAANAVIWSAGLKHAAALLVPGKAHAMAIYFDVADQAVGFLRTNLAAG
jgi:dienelactone hydrolase